MSKSKDLLFTVGLAIVIMTLFLNLSVIVVAAHQGLVSGTLLSQCKDKYQRPCELIAVPKEIE